MSSEIDENGIDELEEADQDAIKKLKGECRLAKSELHKVLKKLLSKETRIKHSRYALSKLELDKESDIVEA